MNVFQKKYLQWLKIKTTYPFHFAHKPLCERHKGNTFHIGNTYLCRGCTLIYTAIFSAITLSFLIPLDNQFVNCLFSVVLLISVILSHPNLYKRLHRNICDITRYTFGLTSTYLSIVLFKTNMVIIPFFFAALYFCWTYYKKKRSESRSFICKGCPELNKKQVCTGYELQTKLTKKYEIRVEEYIEKLR